MNGMIKNIQIHINPKGEEMKPILVSDKLLFDYKAIEVIPSLFGVVIYLTEDWKISSNFIDEVKKLDKNAANSFSKAIETHNEKVIEEFKTCLFSSIMTKDRDEQCKYIKIDENLIFEKIIEALK